VNLIKSEFLKVIYQRRTYGLLLVGVALAALAAGVSPWAMTQLTQGNLGSLSQAAAIDSVYAKALGSYIFVVIIGVMMMASEFQHHTAIATYLVSPKRSNAYFAKLVVATIVGAIYMLITTGLGMVAGAIALGYYPDAVAPTDGKIIDLLAASLLIGAVLSVMGLAIGTLIRNQNAAVTTSLVWFFLVDRLLGVLFTDIGKYLPTGLVTAMMNLQVKVKTGGITIDSSQYLDPWPATGLLLAYGVVFGAVAMATSMRRDID
jgi:ABC-type transport system involved in multi-copper enzyme maturation permease subunit